MSKSSKPAIQSQRKLAEESLKGFKTDYYKFMNLGVDLK